jgi:hypothetical protein
MQSWIRLEKQIPKNIQENIVFCLTAIILHGCHPKTIEQQVEKLIQTDNLSDKIQTDILWHGYGYKKQRK